MSRVLRRSNDLFLHIPRTGGTTVEVALRKLRIKTVPAAIRDFLLVPRNHYLLAHRFASRLPLRPFRFAFAFVRHPLAYYESVWKWITVNKPNPHPVMREVWGWEPRLSADRNWCPDFSEWVERMLHREPLWYTRIVEGFVGPEGGEFCAYIGRTETLITDLLDALSRLGYSDRVCAAGDLVKSLCENTASAPLEWDQRLREEVLYQERLVLRRFYGDNLLRRWYGRLRHRDKGRSQCSND